MTVSRRNASSLPSYIRHYCHYDFNFTAVSKHHRTASPRMNSCVISATNIQIRRVLSPSASFKAAVVSPDVFCTTQD